MTPSSFIAQQAAACLADARSRSLDRPRALDVAMGRGRHAIVLARAGFRTFGVDVKLDALRDALQTAAAERLPLRVWCADLRHHPLPARRFDLIVVSRYLQRDLFPSLQAATAPAGVVLYETFTTLQRACGSGPTSPDHLLEPGELRARFAAPQWDVLFYEETRAPEAVARIAARRRS
jgi:SAM-dependent methyltransferase